MTNGLTFLKSTHGQGGWHVVLKDQRLGDSKASLSLSCCVLSPKAVARRDSQTWKRKWPLEMTRKEKTKVHSQLRDTSLPRTAQEACGVRVQLTRAALLPGKAASGARDGLSVYSTGIRSCSPWTSARRVLTLYK